MEINQTSEAPPTRKKRGPKPKGEGAPPPMPAEWVRRETEKILKQIAEVEKLPKNLQDSNLMKNHLNDLNSKLDNLRSQQSAAQETFEND